jgi:SAM-dependent methyltransferase
MIERSEESESPEYDSRYLDWKRWEATEFGRCSDSDAEVFAAECSKAGREFSGGTRVLEIGFGNGAFLGFARSRGWDVEGVEANPDLVERAKAAGFQARHARDLEGFETGTFQLIAAFDVMEHIPRASLSGFMAEVRRLLVDGGIFLARFPNGDSPFGLVNQNGDVTHATAIGSVMVRHLAGCIGATLLYVGAPAVAIERGGRRKAAEDRLRRFLIGKLDRLLNWMVFPGQALSFFSPNLVMMIQVRKRDPDD